MADELPKLEGGRFRNERTSERTQRRSSRKRSLLLVLLPFSRQFYLTSVRVRALTDSSAARSTPLVSCSRIELLASLADAAYRLAQLTLALSPLPSPFHSPFPDLHTLTNMSSPVEIHSVSEWNAALRSCKAEGKTVAVDFHATWCELLWLGCCIGMAGSDHGTRRDERRADLSPSHRWAMQADRSCLCQPRQAIPSSASSPS